MISKKEVINCFFYQALISIKNEKEVSNFNIVFNSNINDLISDMNIDTSYIDISKNSDKAFPTMYIEDSNLFFDYLTNIINSLIELRHFYSTSFDNLSLCYQVLTRIWMRMDNNDFNDVISFLQKQLDFICDDTFLGYRYPKKVDEFAGRDIICENSLNMTWDETDSSLYFFINDKENIHSLSNVYYGIRYENNEKVCYIYAVQNKNNDINKKIQRKLYHLNKGIDNPNVHPNQVYTLILFINECIKNGITKIKVPKIQVLNHRFHDILSKQYKKTFQEKWTYDNIQKASENNLLWLDFQEDINWYHHIVDSSSKIDYLKRDKLFNLVERMKYHFDNIEFIYEDDNIKEYSLRRNI